MLNAVLDGERDLIAHGETARSSLAADNYRFEANGIDADGFANVRLLPDGESACWSPARCF